MFTFSDNEEKNQNQNQETKNIISQQNKIFLYSEINRSSSFKFSTILDETVKDLISKYGIDPPPIKILINSNGGLVSDAFSMYNSILEAKKLLTVETYVDGMVASAATFLSIAGHKRYIYKRSMMLIHQLSAGYIGKYEEIKDFYVNMTTVMEMIKDLYLEYTKMPMNELEKILKHDLYLPSSKCLKYGLVDEII